jgi:hypothetical protein
MVTMFPPLEFGLLSGLIHHFATQYINQADVFMTLSAFGLSNVLYAVLWTMSRDPGVICSTLIGRFLRDLVLFNTVYVSAASMCLTKTSKQLRLSQRLFTTFISGIEGSPVNSGSKQRIGACGISRATERRI